MSAEWVTPLATLAGAALGGLLFMLNDFFKSRRSVRERYQQLIAEKRLDNSQDLLKRLLKFEVKAAPMIFGAESLKWPIPEDAVVSDSQRERAEEVDKALRNLNWFVFANEIVLGAQVVRQWHVFSAAIEYLRSTLRSETADDLIVAVAADAIIGEAVDEIGKAVRDSLESGNVELVSFREWTLLRQAGQKKAQDLLDAKEKELRKA